MDLSFFTARRFTFFLTYSFLLVFFSACAGTSKAPVSSRQDPAPVKRAIETETGVKKQSRVKTRAKENSKKQNASQGFHIVNKGETLYSIAWRYGYDFRDVSGWNQIGSPYTIYPGQLIRLKPSQLSNKNTLQPGPVLAKKTNNKHQKTRKPKTATVEKAKKTTAAKQTKVKKTRSVSGKIIWQWPAKGKIIKSNLPTSKKGLDISGVFGQDIKTAASGNVVYSGSGLLGYGRLIIIKHNETYLSAYAHNSEILVQEGDDVVAGQKIARMGKTSGGQVLLHFEIRKNGQSINPVGLLPKS